MGPTFTVVCFSHQQPTPRRNASQWLLGTFCHQKVQKQRAVDANRLGKSRVVARRLSVVGCRLTVDSRRSSVDSLWVIFNFQFSVFHFFCIFAAWNDLAACKPRHRRATKAHCDGKKVLKSNELRRVSLGLSVQTISTIHKTESITRLSAGFGLFKRILNSQFSILNFI
jgi:hypothetical protein